MNRKLKHDSNCTCTSCYKEKISALSDALDASEQRSRIHRVNAEYLTEEVKKYMNSYEDLRTLHKEARAKIKEYKELLSCLMEQKDIRKKND